MLSNISNITVLLRVCFDLPDLRNLARVSNAVPTIAQLLSQGNKIVLISHWGRPAGKIGPEFSYQRALLAIQRRLDRDLQRLGFNAKLELELVDQTSPGVDFQSVAKYIQASSNRIFLLENTRFMSAEQSTRPSARLELAKQYANLGTYLVQEDFAVSHRLEATVKELSQILPFTRGLAYRAEIQHLDQIKHNPKRPLVLIMGGAKLETKLPLLERMLPLVDSVLLGGNLCFTFLQASGSQVNFGESHVESDFISRARQLWVKYQSKIILPVDFIFDPAGKQAFDIGPETLRIFATKLQKAQTAFWNGPMGLYEKVQYRHGTLALAQTLSNLADCNVILGGGDTNAALPAKLLQKFDFVSMGGGATLEYLASAAS